MRGQMKNKINYSAEAKRDLEDIWDYVAFELSNPSAARRTVNRIMDDVDRLASFPELGALLSSITNRVTDYRYLVTGNYLTFYRVLGDAVYVDRILFGRRDYLRILFGDITGESSCE